MLRDRAAIAGVGWTEYSKNSGVSTLALALRAITAACDDAGIGIHDIDGMSTHRVGDSANDQSCYCARYQPHRNGRLNYLCPDIQAIGDDCYRRDISRDRKLAKRGQSGQQEQSSL